MHKDEETETMRSSLTAQVIIDLSKYFIFYLFSISLMGFGVQMNIQTNFGPTKMKHIFVHKIHRYVHEDACCSFVYSIKNLVINKKLVK